MHADNTDKEAVQRRFTRLVVVRLTLEEWPLLETAAREHGSYRAAVLAGLQSLDAHQKEAPAPSETAAPEPHDRTTIPPGRKVRPRRARPTAPNSKTTQATPETATRSATNPRVPADADQELSAREAAALLGIKTATARAYIREGRLPGHYDGRWKTTRQAVDAHRKPKRADAEPPGN